jgi:hypothetical protein
MGLEGDVDSEDKSMEEYVLGKVLEPKDKEEREWKRWNATDSIVLTWLLNSLTLVVALLQRGSALHINRDMECPIKNVVGQGKCHGGLSN